MLSEVLSVAIGVFFVYLLLSLMCSTVVQGLSRILALRGWNLKRWVNRLLTASEDKESVKKLYEHPLIKVLPTEWWWRNPAAIPPDRFARALIDIVIGDLTKVRPATIKELVSVIDKSSCHGKTKEALGALLVDASDIKKALEKIAEWFDGPMDLVRAKYREVIAVLVFVTALAVCVPLNLDTIMIVQVLWKQSDLRADVEAAAVAFTSDLETQDIEEMPGHATTLTDAASKLANAGIPLGWSSEPDDPRNRPDDRQGWIMKVMGVFATVVAASLGAPFWFDLLKRLIGLRQGRAG